MMRPQPKSDDKLVADILMAVARPFTPVYPLYLASRIKYGLAKLIGRGEDIIASVGDIETVGNCIYCVKVKDCLGQTYRITVEPPK